MDVKQMSRKDLMKLATPAAQAELQERNDLVRACRDVIAAMKAREAGLSAPQLSEHEKPER